MVAGLFFLLLGIFLAILFWLVMFLLRSQLLDFQAPFYVMSCSSLPTFKIHSLFVSEFSSFNYYVSWSVPVCVPLDWDSLCFLDLCGLTSYQIRKFSIITFSNRFSIPFSSFSFWYPYYMNIITFNVFCISLKPLHFF